MGEDAKAKALNAVLAETGGSSLGAWLKHFDKNGDQKITFDEFCIGLKELCYSGDVVALWNDMDEDKSGEITLEEIDQESSDIWRSFQRWAATSFSSARDMIAQLSGGGSAKVTQDQFCDIVRTFNWKGRFEELLFAALDTRNLGYVTSEDLKFVDRERTKIVRKETAKQKAAFMQNKKARAKLQAAKALLEFKRHLRKKYGHFVKAWRVAIDMDGSMSVQQKELFKACSAMTWSGDVRALWRALDTDDSGVTALEELDASSAQVLARFKELCETKFGSVMQGFRALDRHGIKRLKCNDFVHACKAIGFEKGRFLYEGLNTSGKKFLTESDLAFLDEWKPPAWLTAYPDEAAATDLKALLLRKYKNYLKAWRRVLDKDSSNRVNWHEFEQACKRLHFTQNVPGAWRFLDDDLSGYITLKEIDEGAYHVLMEFKVWADSEFGGVRSGFKVLDSDGGGDLSYREFRRAVRDFGFTGNPKLLFDSLGSTETSGGGENSRKVQIEDIAFLDAWEVELPSLDDLDQESQVEEPEKQKQIRSTGLVFETAGPGPGSYNLPSTFGTKQSGGTTARHNGSYTFRKRAVGSQSLFKDFDLDRDGTPEPGPGSYEHGAGWRTHLGHFPRSARLGMEVASHTPGPGTYHPNRQTEAPSWSCTPRRQNRVHPNRRADLCSPRREPSSHELSVLRRPPRTFTPVPAWGPLRSVSPRGATPTRGNERLPTPRTPPRVERLPTPRTPVRARAPL